jgi:hypothetical protein
MLGIAVTSHNDGADPNTEAVVSNFGPYTGGSAPAITTQPPQQSHFGEQQAGVEGVATGDPLHYEWRKNGTPVATNGLGATYTVPLAKTTDSGDYTVRVYGGGKEVISSAAKVTVTVDTTPPTLVSAVSVTLPSPALS